MHAQSDRRKAQSAQSPALDVGRAALNRALPSAIRLALKNYRNMASAKATEDAKAFQQQQVACKAALQHIEALLKLAGLAEPATTAVPSDALETASLLARAEAAVEAYEHADTATDEGE